MAASNTIILTGSSYSVNSPSLEITSFLTVLKQATQINKDLKILGICFGHQALAHQRGVSVITKPLIKGVEEIQFQDSITMNVPYFQQFRQLSSKKLKCLEYHNDHVTEVPNNHILVASSSKCSIEALISQDFKILSFQFHPEFTAEYIQFYEKCLSNYSNNSDKNSLKVDINANQAEEHHKSIDIVRKTIRHFLSWKIV